MTDDDDRPFIVLRSRCKDCGGASICEHNRVRSICMDCGDASICARRRVRSKCMDCKRRLSLPPPPPARSCNRMLGIHAHAPHDTSRTSDPGSCRRHRRSPVRARSTHSPAMPSCDCVWPCLHSPSLLARTPSRTPQRTRAHAVARIHARACRCLHPHRRIRTQHLSHMLSV